jgi:hypothetical protein
MVAQCGGDDLGADGCAILAHLQFKKQFSILKHLLCAHKGVAVVVYRGVDDRDDLFMPRALPHRRWRQLDQSLRVPPH